MKFISSGSVWQNQNNNELYVFDRGKYTPIARILKKMEVRVERAKAPTLRSRIRNFFDLEQDSLS